VHDGRLVRAELDLAHLGLLHRACDVRRHRAQLHNTHAARRASLDSYLCVVAIRPNSHVRVERTGHFVGSRRTLGFGMSPRGPRMRATCERMGMTEGWPMTRSKFSAPPALISFTRSSAPTCHSAVSPRRRHRCQRGFVYELRVSVPS